MIVSRDVASTRASDMCGVGGVHGARGSVAGKRVPSGCCCGLGVASQAEALPKEADGVRMIGLQHGLRDHDLADLIRVEMCGLPGDACLERRPPLLRAK